MTADRRSSQWRNDRNGVEGGPVCGVRFPATPSLKLSFSSRPRWVGNAPILVVQVDARASQKLPLIRYANRYRLGVGSGRADGQELTAARRQKSDLRASPFLCKRKALPYPH
jgi:hypothetical protein